MGVSYDILDSDFDKKLSTAYQLSILAGMDSLVFFVFDAASGNALQLRSIPYVNAPASSADLDQELRAAFARESLFSYLFRRVRVTLPVGASLLVPSRLYNESEKEIYLRELVNHQGADGTIRHDEIPEVGSQLVYFSYPDLIKTLKRQFPTAHVVHPATPFLLGAKQMLEDEYEHTLFAHFSKDVVYLALFEKKNLLFYNAFPYSTAGDVLYFTLLSLDQFGLDPAKTPVNLSGRLLEDAEIFRMLSRYLGQLRFIPAPPFLKFGRRFNEVQPYFFFDLYALALCK